jgi:hypothetical protein
MNEGVAGVFVTHVNSDTKYHFKWDYDLEPKTFVHNVKNIMFANHYPRLKEVVYVKKELSPREMAIALEKGKKPVKVEFKKVGERRYVLDKVILWKNLVLLKLENSTIKSDELDVTYRYKYEGSLVVYLRKYRTGKFKTIDDASKEFFENSLLIDKLGEKEEETIG